MEEVEGSSVPGFIHWGGGQAYNSWLGLVFYALLHAQAQASDHLHIFFFSFFSLNLKPQKISN